MDRLVQEIIADLKSYLEYLREMGIESMTASEERPKEVFLNSSLLPSMSPPLEEVRKELGDCRRCKLHRTRRTLVFGEGNKKAILMIIGEGPGYEEDVQGKPFVGRAGKFLNQLLGISGIQREKAFITSPIKCFPPKNRKPKIEEIISCLPYFKRQIEIINPRKLILLGEVAFKIFFPDKKLKDFRGKLITLRPFDTLRVALNKIEGRQSQGKKSFFITYHPAAGIRFLKMKKILEKDFKNLKKKI